MLTHGVTRGKHVKALWTNTASSYLKNLVTILKCAWGALSQSVISFRCLYDRLSDTGLVTC